MKFEIYKDLEGYWRWRLKADNGEILASGKGYQEKEDAVKAVNVVMDTSRKTPCAVA